MGNSEKVAWLVAAFAAVCVATLAADAAQGGALLDGASASAWYRAGVMALVIWVACAAMSFNFRSSWEDERDDAIRHRAGGVAYAYALAMLTAATLALGYGRQSWIEHLAAVPLARALLLLLASTALLQALVQILLYRRQSA